MTVKSDPKSLSSSMDMNSKIARMVLRPHCTNEILLSFGFEDGISQPLLDGIDLPDALSKDNPMLTPQNVITVPLTAAEAPKIHALNSAAKPDQRPLWMKEGSFLVFRKLEQDVPGFNKLAEKYATLENSTPDLCGAKLMGRWKSGRHFSRSLQILPSVKDRLTSDERCSNYPL